MEIDPNIPIQKQLSGLGQLRDLRTNPNLKGVDLNIILSKTPLELNQMLNNQEINLKTYRQIMKTFENRDLGKRGKNK